MGRNRSGWVLDFFVILIGLSGVVVSLFLFQRDLFTSLRSMTQKPVGTVTVKYNTVQRRLDERVLWDRLFRESPVYPGDLIRVAKLSGAVLNIADNHIELNENTLIRIGKGAGPTQIELSSGNLSINAGADIVLSVGGHQLQAGTGTVLSASADEEGTALRVNEGAAFFIQEGEARQALAGTVILHDIEGREQFRPTVNVLQPRPNARYLNNRPQPLNINFSWERVNLETGDRLKLELAEDQNFTRIVQVIEGLNAGTTAAVDNGLWHWRISLRDNVLSSGQAAVVNAAPPALISPAANRRFIYRSNKPDVHFRWMDIEEASSYILQIGQSPDFSDSSAGMQVHGNSFVYPGLNPGTWYWRVTPVYPSIYEGRAFYSGVSSFHIEQIESLAAPVLNTPEPDAVVNVGPDRSDFYFTWTGAAEAVSYTILIAADPDLLDPVISRVTRNNFYVYEANAESLMPGRCYWSVFYSDAQGDLSPLPPARAFLAAGSEIIHRAVSPPDGTNVTRDTLSDTRFTWRSNLPVERRFQVSDKPDFSSLQIDAPVTEEAFQITSLTPGQWYWRVVAKADASAEEHSTLPRRFNLNWTLPAVVMVSPAADGQVTLTTGRTVEFLWRAVGGAEYYRFCLYAASSQTVPVYEREVRGLNVSVPVDEFGNGLYNWTVQAVSPEGASGIRQMGEIARERFTLQKFRQLTLASPAAGAVLSGLTVLREQTVFRWNTSEDVGRSRFILSRNSDPARGRPEVEIANPDRTIRIDRLGEGMWYWTVEAWTPAGFYINAGPPRQLYVQPISLLQAPGNMLPAGGHRINSSQIRSNMSLAFSWSEVEGANAYIFIIFEEAPSGRRQVLRADPQEKTGYTLSDLSLLDYQKTYIWQVEAVNRNRDGVIEQRGRPGENSFVLDIPGPGRVQPGSTGVLYGN